MARDTGDNSPRVSQLRADHGVQFIAYLREQRGNAGSTVQSALVLSSTVLAVGGVALLRHPQYRPSPADQGSERGR